MNANNTGKPALSGMPARIPVCIACMLMLAIVAGCASTGTRGETGEGRAASLASRGQHELAASVYADLAGKASGPERDRLTLLAVEQWLDAGDGRRAGAAMATVSKPDSGDMLWQWSANAAALSLWEGRPDDAMRILEPLSRQPLPSRYRVRIEALRADAWFQKDEPVRAVELYIQRENWLDDRQSIELNRKRLWAGLLVSDMHTLRAAVETVSDPEVKGWLTLGALATSTGRHGIGWYNGVVRWQEAHRNHPANGLLADLPRLDDGPLEFPQQIALLLPLSGENASAGNAIQNGFLGAYFSATASFNDEQRVKVYDVVTAGGAEAAYTRAVNEGADFVVGPLLRSNVEDLASDMVLPAPVLTLNYLPDDVLAPPGLYQFALSPEDEAKSAALKAIADGHRRAVALVPENDWGRRVLTSFASAFETAGGVLLDYRSYPPSNQDFSTEIEHLLALSLSVQRYERLRANIGGPLQFDPRRRQDAEFVFMAADARSGRLLKSQLKFHYAGDLPVYSTSFIYSMDGRSDSDLNGVKFADTPWLVSPHSWFADLPALYKKFWPGDRRLGRLHAMGYDAYHLVGELFNARTEPMQEFAGATGRLYLDNEGRVHRRLAWAQFVHGEPVALRPTREFDPPLREGDGEN